jgi:hypothetical protein
MNGQIRNSPIRPTTSLQPHHLRHIISGTLVFFLGIGANEALMYARKHWPKKVRWSQTEIQHDFTVPNELPPAHVEVDIGITEDGSFVWRPHKEEK